MSSTSSSTPDDQTVTHYCVLCPAEGVIQAEDGWYCAECVHQRGSCCWADEDENGYADGAQSVESRRE